MVKFWDELEKLGQEHQIRKQSEILVGSSIASHANGAGEIRRKLLTMIVGSSISQKVGKCRSSQVARLLEKNKNSVERDSLQKKNSVGREISICPSKFVH